MNIVLTVSVVLQDGMWRGEQVLPVGWVAYSTTPTAAFSGYGAGWWLGYPGDPPASHPADGPHLPPCQHLMASVALHRSLPPEH